MDPEIKSKYTYDKLRMINRDPMVAKLGGNVIETEEERKYYEEQERLKEQGALEDPDHAMFEKPWWDRTLFSTSK